MVACGMENTVDVIDLRTNRLICRNEGVSNAANFSTDTRYLCSMDCTRRIHSFVVIDVRMWKPVYQARRSMWWDPQFCFGSAQPHVVACYSSHAVNLWEADTGRSLVTLNTLNTREFAGSEDGQMFISGGGGGLTLWSTTNLEAVK